MADGAVATTLTPPIGAQRSFWNSWNTEHREQQLSDVSGDQLRVAVGWLQALGRNDLSIMEVGCGTGWMAGVLRQFGQVTATDLADDVVARAAVRYPEVKFLAGDFTRLDLPASAYDVVVCFEVLSHVADQPAFIAALARLLKPGGHLMLATQNRPALLMNDIPPPAPGQIRRWVGRRELTRLLASEFQVETLLSVTPRFNRGLLRRLNSERFARLARSVGLGWTLPWIKRLQERMGLGWTLMAHATRRP